MSATDPKDGFLFSRHSVLKCACGKCPLVYVLERSRDVNGVAQYTYKSGGFVTVAAESEFIVGGYTEIPEQEKQRELPTMIIIELDLNDPNSAAKVLRDLLYRI